MRSPVIWVLLRFDKVLVSSSSIKRSDRKGAESSQTTAVTQDRYNTLISRSYDMGYMGFGLQRWIYKQRARRPFTKDRKPSGEFGDYHHDNNYIDKVLSSSSGKKRIITKEDSERAAHRLDKKMRDATSFLILKRILISVLVILGISLIVNAYISSRKPNDRNKQAVFALADSKCNRGDEYFIKGRFYAARDNYLEALTYNPNSFRAYYGLALSYGNLCPESDTHCVNGLKIIEKIKKKFPEEDITELIELEIRLKEKLEINVL